MINKFAQLIMTRLIIFMWKKNLFAMMIRGPVTLMWKNILYGLRNSVYKIERYVLSAFI